MKKTSSPKKFLLVFFPVILGAVLFISGFFAGLYQAAQRIRIEKTAALVHRTLHSAHQLFSTYPVKKLTAYDLFKLDVLNEKSFDGVKTIHPFSHSDTDALTFDFSPPYDYTLTLKNLPRHACFLTATRSLGNVLNARLKAVVLTRGNDSKIFPRPENFQENASFVPLSDAERFCKKETNVSWVMRVSEKPDTDIPSEETEQIPHFINTAGQPDTTVVAPPASFVETPALQEQEPTVVQTESPAVVPATQQAPSPAPAPVPVQVSEPVAFDEPVAPSAVSPTNSAPANPFQLAPSVSKKKTDVSF